MTRFQDASGQCLCGAVTFTANIGKNIDMCHCSQCRRWSGGGPLHVVDVQELELLGQDRIVHFSASEWGERGFCGTCGTSIYWKMKGKPPMSLAVGLLNDQSGLKAHTEIFEDCRAPWSIAYPDTEKSSEADEMAKLRAYQARQT